MSEKRNTTKAFRIPIIIDYLKRSGPADKDQIFSHVSQKIDEDASTESFQRAIYRDLEDLVTKTLISAQYFRRDGTPIDDYDPEVHKNVMAKWFIETEEGKITGAGHLEKANGLIYVPPVVKNEFAIVTGQSTPGPKYRHVYFQVGNKFLCLKTSLDAIEYKLALSRTHGDISLNEINEVKARLGTRTAILKLPFAKLSSYKPEVKICHTQIKLLENSEVEVEDFGSINGVMVYQLTMNEADEMRCKGETINEETVTSAWMMSSNFKATPQEVKNKIKLKCPLLIEIGGTCHILIM